MKNAEVMKLLVELGNVDGKLLRTSWSVDGRHSTVDDATPIDLTAASACDHDVHSTTHNSLDEAAAAQLVFFDWLLF